MRKLKSILHSLIVFAIGTVAFYIMLLLVGALGLGSVLDVKP